MASKLNISVNTVKTQKLRAKEMLRTCMADDYLALSLLITFYLSNS
ncbi:hypothetical protein [Carboxylicivirga litoralis]